MIVHTRQFEDAKKKCLLVACNDFSAHDLAQDLQYVLQQHAVEVEIANSFSDARKRLEGNPNAFDAIVCPVTTATGKQKQDGLAFFNQLEDMGISARVHLLYDDYVESKGAKILPEPSKRPEELISAERRGGIVYDMNDVNWITRLASRVGGALAATR